MEKSDTNQKEKEDDKKPTNAEMLQIFQTKLSVGRINKIIELEGAHSEVERNTKGEITSFKIFNKGGKLIYFANIEELDKYDNKKE